MISLAKRLSGLTYGFLVLDHILLANNLELILPTNRPYSEPRHDRYKSEAVRDRLTMFPMASAVKS